HVEEKNKLKGRKTNKKRASNPLAISDPMF
ncbi:Secreted protein acidic and rich in cysteine, partial [Araneus ventricosus]